ncbi:hypothetical protein TCON_1584 [Astathelohania contejeani]|uniref:Uncharacterized protein n=1 Tax=Astathelohania contejeani TaxID=164912 RepID=A0ABQ7HYD4_9MICR|nr:hypothetical protein TCON_1584 [Thelohania contejeani]
MMILKIFLKNYKYIIKYQKQLKMFILIISTFFIIPSKSPNNISTRESIHENLYPTENVSNEDIILEENNEILYYKIGNQSMFKTIAIVITIRDDFEIPITKKLISSLKNSKFKYRSIEFFIKKEKKTLKSLIPTLNFDYISRSKYKRPGYFCTIELNFCSKSSTNIFPLRNHQPNSDLNFLSYNQFPPRTIFNLSEFFIQKKIGNINKINISLKPNDSDIKKFIFFIRILNNLSYHSLGTYYYSPFPNYHINMVSLIPFYILIFLIGAVDFAVRFNQKSKIDIKLLSICLYPICPFICIFYINEYGIRLCSIILFFVISNFKMGYLFCILIYIRTIFQILKK